MVDEDAKFHWADYLVFVVTLTISLCVGCYFAYSSRKKKTSEEFLLAGRNMNFIPVSLSLLASTVSGIAIIGVPADIYYRGSVYLWVCLGLVITGFVTCFIFIPTYHCMHITSAYEYFEVRFKSRVLRELVSLTFAIGLLCYLGVVLYIPAIAFSEVTGLDINFSILTCGLVCTLYTAVGGMKAVIWTDTIQMSTVFIGLILLGVMGIYDDRVGGPSVVLDRAKDGDRLDLYIWDPDPRVRHTFWTQVIGVAFTWTASLGTNQLSVQRYLSVKRQRNAQLSVLCLIIGIWILNILIGILSLTMYAYYYQCDPKEAGRIEKSDQLVPRFLMDVMGDLHGLPGLFTSAVYSASISTISSGVNSLAAVTLEDFVKPAYQKLQKEDMSQSSALWTSRGLALLYGAITIGLSFVAEYLGDNVLTVVNSLSGILATPVLGCFTLGLFVSWCTSTGCIAGLLSGISIGLWMNVGSVLHGSEREDLPVSSAGCSSFFNESVTTSSALLTTMMAEDSDENALQDFYDVSYAWYGLITWLTVMIVGMLVSLLQLRCSPSRMSKLSDQVDHRLVYDVKGRCCCCCPGVSPRNTTCKRPPKDTKPTEERANGHFSQPVADTDFGNSSSQMWENIQYRPTDVEKKPATIGTNFAYVTQIHVNRS